MRREIVQKFGGTSVGSAEAIRRVGAIVKGARARNPVVVVSAVGGVTNKLFSLAEAALARGAWESAYRALIAQHEELMASLELEPSLVAELFSELSDLVRGIALIRELTPRTHDYLASFGERISARLVAAHLRSLGLPARAFDAWDAGLVTDSHFGAARPLPGTQASIRGALAEVTEIVVVTGYIGQDANGRITTLGRGGSDYSAAIFGAALGVDEIQIWTDVDGVMTADPRKVSGARIIGVMSFAEAAELAFFGAKVLHPATMIPAVEKNIPIRVLNTFRPEGTGTRVVRELQSSEKRVKSIATKDAIVAVNVVAGEMMFQYGFMERIADVFARHEIVIDVITTSEVSVALTTDPKANLEPVVAELARFAAVEVVRDISLVSVVGEELRDSVGFAAKVFACLAELGVSVEMISYGATRNNLSFVVREARLKEVVSALHARLFA